MGCITSSKKLNELSRHENVFRVRVVHLLPDTPTVLTGYLELTTRELIFYSPGCEPVFWALQHLRRYGLNGDLFSFEAGRRCMTGPGIYTFRCEDAEALYPLFQRYINAVNMDAFSTSVGVGVTIGNIGFGVERDRITSSHGFFTRGDGYNWHGNNYLEPAPLTFGSGGVRSSFYDAGGNNGGGVCPLSPAELDSPDSVPSLPFNGEAAPTHTTNNTNPNQSQVQSPSTPGAMSTYANANLGFDQALRTLHENTTSVANNTIAASTTTVTNSSLSTGGSAFSTMNRRTLLRGCSLDMPPLESAPGPSNTESLHMYANVDTPGAGSLRERLLFDNAERCYENVNRLDLPLLLQQPPVPSVPRRESSQQSVASCAQQSQQPATPTSATPSTSGVNYIVLDLDQPRSPTQSSPKTQTGGFGSGFSLAPATSSAERAVTTTVAASSAAAKMTIAAAAASTTPTKRAAASSEQLNAPTLTVSTPTTTTTTPTATLEQHKSESSLGYSTIDFIKTCALIKSTTTTPPHNFDSLRMRDNEELRLTRHSKCVRKSYSVSE